MAVNVVFDTHEYILSMTEAGIEPRAAEAIAKGQLKFLNENVATKTDVANIQRDIERCKSDLLKWFIGTLPVFASIILAGVAVILQLFLN